MPVTSVSVITQIIEWRVSPWPELGRSVFLTGVWNWDKNAHFSLSSFLQQKRWEMGSCGSAVLGAMCPEKVKTPAEKEERNLQREKQRGEREHASLLPAGFLTLGSSPPGDRAASTLGLKFASLLCNVKKSFLKHWLHKLYDNKAQS